MAWSLADQLGERDPLLPRAKRKLAGNSYGAALREAEAPDYTDVVTQPWLDALRVYKNNVQFDVDRGRRPGPNLHVDDPTFDWATKKQMGLLEPATPPPPTVPPRALYSFTGTWGAWNNGFGFDVGERIDRGLYQHQGLGFNTNAFMIGNDPGHSYIDMLNDGEAEFLRFARNDFRPKVLAGYSGGAGCVVQALNNWPVDRRHEIIGVVQFGDPNRPPGKTLLGNDPGGHGISEDFPGGWVLDRYYSFTLDGDMYPNAVGLLPIFYDILVRMEASVDFIKYLFQLLVDQLGNLTGIGGQLLGLAGPLSPFFGIMGSMLPLLGGGANSERPVNLMTMLFNIPAIIQSLIALIKFAMTGAHGKYNDPGQAIFGGLTAVDRAVQIVNGL